MATAQFGNVLRHIRHLAISPAAGNLADAELVGRFADQHDHAAFAELARRHGRLVWGVCRHVLQHDEDAEDAFQATFLALALKAASLRTLKTVAGWLHGAAYRSAMQIRRQAARRRFHERQASTMAQRIPPNETAWRELQAVLDEEVQRLPEKYRAPFVLCCLERKTKPEAARQLGWKEGTVSSRLAEARKQLQRRLARRGVSLSALLSAAVLSQEAAGSVVPAALMAATVRAALGVAAAGAAVPAVVSAKVAGAVKGVTNAMFMTQCKIATGLLLGLSVATGAGVLTHMALAQTNAAVQQTTEPQPANTKAELVKPELVQQAHADRYGDPLPPGALVRLGTVRLRPGDRVNDAAFSRDGRALALGSERTLGLWDIATGKEIRRFAERPNFESVAFSPDGKLLAAGSWDVRLWDVETGKELRVFSGHQDWIRRVIFSPDGRMLASAGEDKIIRLWDLITGRELRHLKGHQASIFSIAFSPDGRTLASTGIDRTIRLWQVSTGKELHRLKGAPLEGYPGWIGSAIFSPDAKTLVSAHGDGTIHFWDPDTGRELRQFKGHDDNVCRLAFSRDGKILVSSGGDGTIRLWDFAPQTLLTRASS